QARGARRIPCDIGVVPARTVRSPTTGIGAELLAHREKIEVRPTASPVVRFSGADSRAHRRCTRAVCALPQRMPQTWDSLAEREGFEPSVPVAQYARLGLA